MMGKQATKVKATEYDAANYMDSPKAICAFLDAELDGPDADSGIFMEALDAAARAKGISNLAKETGLGRESLYKTLSGDVDPNFSTVLAIMQALGLKFSVKAIKAKQ